MGKSVGFIGPITGKIGTMVFYYRNGKQVQRAYVPSPANPRSSKQVSNRLKFALAGRLSSVVPAEALEGMPGGNKSERRSSFLRSVLKNSTSSGGAATILDEDIVFSEGNLALVPSHVVTAVASDVPNIRSVDVQVSLRAEGISVPEGYGERYVALFLNDGTSQFDYAVTGLLEIPAVGDAATTRISAVVGDKFSSYSVLVYSCPFVGDRSIGGLNTSYIGINGDNVSVNVDTGEVSVGGVEYGRSILLLRVSVAPPSAQSSLSSGDGASSGRRK